VIVLAAGLFSSAVIVAAILSALGDTVGRAIPSFLRLDTVVLAGAAVALIDLYGRLSWAPGWARQTDPTWRHTLGARLAPLMWGVDLGLGFTTFRVTSGFWLIVLLSILLGGSAPILAVGAYAIGQIAAVAGGTALNPRALRSAAMRGNQLMTRVKLIWGTTIVVWAISGAILLTWG
jgi:hypothetical protein